MTSLLPVKKNNSGDNKNKEILAVIPARSGSKGLPGKNLAVLGGIPLLAHSILAAKSCPLITRCIVSTDSKQIADVAREWGAEVPFLRPGKLSGDTALLSDVFRHLLKFLDQQENYTPECIVYLLPTHPFRSKKMMEELVGKLAQGYKNVITVKHIKVEDTTYFVHEDNKLISVHGNRDAHTCYRRYGLFTGNRLKQKDRYQRNIYAYPLKTAYELIDIDTFKDLETAREMLKKKLYIPEWGVSDFR
jgi:CMP-N-acetylneuraminic acid synthetase